MINYEIYRHKNINIPEEIVNYVIYSHSSFTDVLDIQTDYIQGLGRLILLINSNTMNLEHIYSRYDEVIFYNSDMCYGEKLLSCIEQIKYDYFVLLHDNDILLHVDKPMIMQFTNFLRKNNFDRIDFQLSYDFDESNIINDEEIYLIRSSNADTTKKGYIYNVNPSLWKRDALINILTKFRHKDYRNIEDDETQEYCKNFVIFKLYNKNKYNCGYFICLEPFKYLHITHSQKLFAPWTIPAEDSKDIIEDYNLIVNKYNLKKSNKWIG